MTPDYRDVFCRYEVCVTGDCPHFHKQFDNVFNATVWTAQNAAGRPGREYMLIDRAPAGGVEMN